MDHRARLTKQILRSGRHGREQNLVTDEIEHDRRAQQAHFAKREPTEGADLLFELRHRTGVQRIVPGVMRPGRDLVDE